MAIQKSGRLNLGSIEILKDAGILFSNDLNKLRISANNFPLEIFFLRDDDIPQYVQDGVVDVGIVGENTVLEKKKSVRVVNRLDFGKCRLSIAVPRNQIYNDIADLNNRRIATSYSNILIEYLKQKNVKADIHEISGSVEIATSIGLADAICDLVSSGSTLFTNGLKEVEVVLNSEALLIAGESLSFGQQNILDKLLFRINAVKKAKNNKYILLNAPNKNLRAICGILSGIKSPTIMPLAIKWWSSIHSVINEDEFWEIIEKIEKLGAQGILVMPIEKMIM